MATKQPKWKLLWAGDDNALYVDETGQYDAELAIRQDYDDKGAKSLVYRFSLEPMKVVLVKGKKRLVPAAWEPSWPHPAHNYAPWFYKDLGDVARSVGRSPQAMVEDLVSSDPNRLARVYQDIGGYFGYENFDSYPDLVSSKKRWP